ncbi:ribonucleoside-diphosphate reductase large chain [Armillaria solidipes]|uniref:Ribonucleoside-diphosphate reductase n=1 Tax=Armillaria solidipes TaxID=1076256 RepID=A0A2H3BUG0_9AGAR|nr:ribonucleoside-diphosphate reductase large chain [Armillaria solidipes]
MPFQVFLHILTAESVVALMTMHPDYSFLHKATSKKFSAVIEELYAYGNKKGNCGLPLISQEFYDNVHVHAAELDSAIISSCDFKFTYLGFKTLEKSYLLRCNGRIVECPQHLFMRVTVAIHGLNLPGVLLTYELMSCRFFVLSSPTLLNAGSPHSQLSSCFLLNIKEDSIEGVFDTLKDCTVISKSASRIGMSLHTTSASGSYVPKTNGYSSGTVPFLKLFDARIQYIEGNVEQPEAMMVYLEPWHADILDFLELKKNHGKEEARAPHLFCALWIPDLFMRHVEADKNWSLFCPQTVPGLSNVHGSAFDVLYNQYEVEGCTQMVVPARQIWFAALNSQIEMSGPFFLYKDSINEKLNQKNLGTIQSSNLCMEIVQYTSPDEVAVCNLASLVLPSFIDGSCLDFGKLHEVSKAIIDIDHYPVAEAKHSNLRHRLIGLGVQGLADIFIALRVPFKSPEARVLNIQIFETIYHGALEASMELACIDGPYRTWRGSPAEQGMLQYDLWGITPMNLWDWASLKHQIASNGLRNSLLTISMSTVLTSQILGFSESSKPYTSNMYSWHVLAGEFQVVCPQLLQDLVELGIWNDDMKNMILAHNGSLQNICGIPQHIKEVYKTVWEIQQEALLDLAADQAPFICQSQSQSLYLQAPTISQLTNMHFYVWRKGLKTGTYHLWTRTLSQLIQFTMDQKMNIIDDPMSSMTDTSSSTGSYDSNIYSLDSGGYYLQGDSNIACAT